MLLLVLGSGKGDLADHSRPRFLKTPFHRISLPKDDRVLTLVLGGKSIPRTLALAPASVI